MAPNLRFDYHHPRGRHVHQDSADSSNTSSERTSAFADDKTQIGRHLWHDLLRSRDDATASAANALLLQALQSVRILNCAQDHQAWLEEHQGELYEVPLQLIHALAAKAPQRRLAARVADSNENLLYEMQSQRRLEQELGVVEDLQSLVPSNEYVGSFLTTESTVPQPAHVDYSWEVLEGDCEGCLRLGFFPLTKEGMFLQVWPRKDFDGDQDALTKSMMIPGELIFIPHGSLLVLPASTIHGGGFRTTRKASLEDEDDDDHFHGNLRFHLYMARGNGSSLPTHQTNKYTEPHDKGRELCERYVNAPYMEILQQHLFV